MTVPAKLIAGDRRAAILHAAAANANHGLRRTNADKRRSVETLLRDEEWRAWSDAEIARRCLVDPKTVGNIRRELSSTMEIPESDQRKTADGRTMNTANIGEFISPYRLRDDIQAWIEERYTLRTEYLTCLNHLITLKQESQLWPELVKHLPSAAKSRDILTALDLVKERITDAIAADTITTHQLPSGTWYARNHRKYNVDATDSFATEAEAHTAAAAKNWLPGRHFDLAHIDSIIHDLTAREYIGVTRYDNVIKGAEGWLLNEIHIGLEAAAAAEPDQLELQRRLDLVRKRISDLEATIALVRPEPLIVYTGSPSPPSLPQYSPSGQLLPGLTTQVYVKSRRENLFHLRDLYNEVLATLEDYEKLTGIFGHASSTRKAIRPMLEMVERNLGLVPAEQESKDAVHS
jgi:hypothetical protein